jgi:hypothetical protein
MTLPLNQTEEQQEISLAWTDYHIRTRAARDAFFAVIHPAREKLDAELDLIHARARMRRANQPAPPADQPTPPQAADKDCEHEDKDFLPETSRRIHRRAAQDGLLVGAGGR